MTKPVKKQEVTFVNRFLPHIPFSTAEPFPHLPTFKHPRPPHKNKPMEQTLLQCLQLFALFEKYSMLIVCLMTVTKPPFPPSSASNKLYYVSFYFCSSFEIGSHYVSLVGLKLHTKPKLALNFHWTSLTLLGIQTQATKPSLYCVLRLIVFPKPSAITLKVPSIN